MELSNEQWRVCVAAKRPRSSNPPQRTADSMCVASFSVRKAVIKRNWPALSLRRTPTCAALTKLRQLCHARPEPRRNRSM